MHSTLPLQINDHWILTKRGKKNETNASRPNAWHIEDERTSDGKIEKVITVFLTNRECPFRCLMCDLWKNTLDVKTPKGAIPQQLKWALKMLPKAKHIKLYNSGNFFDIKAIPQEDYKAIAQLLDPFENVIIESHPRFINDRLLAWKNLLKGKLEVAIGLETVWPEILPLLNKKMTLEDFRKSVYFLNDLQIRSRAFILLKPPFSSEAEGIFWAKESIQFAFDCGVECAVIIPVRPGNGAMEWLSDQGYFSPPRLSSLEEVVEFGIELRKGRVFVDLWDIEKFSSCDHCLSKKKERLHVMNLKQQWIPPVSCPCETTMESTHTRHPHD